MTYGELLARNDNVRRLWTGQVVSEIGDWLNNIAVLALALALAGPDRQGRAIAVYAIARHLPLFLFGPVAGVVVDRLDRRRVMIAADVVRAVLALGFLAAYRYSSLALVYAVGASLFSVSAFFNAAKRATIPVVAADADELLTTNSLSASTTAATIAVGSALGGLIATFLSRELVFIINAATFIVSAMMIWRIRLPARADSPTQRPAGTSLLRRSVLDFRAGLSYVRNEPVLAAVFVVAAGWGLGNGVARALYSVFGARLGNAAAAGWLARPQDFGISVLFVAMGLGGVLGAPLARRFNAGGTGLGARMGRSLLFDGCGLVLFSFMPRLWPAALVLIAREMNFAIWWTAQQTIIMRRTENAYAGRVFASYETLTTLMMVGSMYFAGAAADRYGIRLVAATGGAVIALSGMTWFAQQRLNGGLARRVRDELTGG
ncbi:MAG TPA: MFS transporter [Pyrinomonadaceae bacterium]